MNGVWVGFGNDPKIGRRLRLDGAIVVAHNASFEERFLRAELDQLGIGPQPIPALCTLEMARNLLPCPNHRLQTCCDSLGVALTDAHSALGDARATARMLPALIRRTERRAITFGCPTPTMPRYQVLARPRTRASGMRKGDQGWIASMLTKLPITTTPADPLDAETYLDALAEALSDGKLTGEEARTLAQIAGRGGLGATEVASLHQRFLDGLRDIALADDILTAQELRELHHAAHLLNVPTYFDDLTVTASEPELTAAAPIDPMPSAVPRRPAAARPVSEGTTPAGPRVWFSPSVSPDLIVEFDTAGAVTARNITRTLRAAIYEPEDVHDPKLARAKLLGVDLVPADAARAMLRLLSASRTPTRSSDQFPQAPVRPSPAPLGGRVLARGERMGLGASRGATTIEVRAHLAGSSEIDMCAFGVDGDRTLTEERYFIFYNQPTSPQDEIRLEIADPGTHRFVVDLDRLPLWLDRIVIALTVDGPDPLANLLDADLHIIVDTAHPTITFPFASYEYTTERAVIIAELYRHPADVWRIAAVAQGFSGGLAALITTFGGTVADGR